VFLAFIDAGMAGMGLVHDAKSMFWVLILQQIGAGMAVPTLIAWAQRRLPFEHRGRGMGVWTSAFFLGQFSSPFLVNELKNTTGSVQGAFVVLGAAALVGAVLSIASLLRRAPKSDLVAV
jgi:MFS family permease